MKPLEGPFKYLLQLFDCVDILLTFNPLKPPNPNVTIIIVHHHCGYCRLALGTQVSSHCGLGNLACLGGSIDHPIKMVEI